MSDAADMAMEEEMDALTHPDTWQSSQPDLYYKITARDFHGAPVKITTEGNTMTLTPKQSRLEAELDRNLDLQNVLKLRADDLREDIRKADLPAPPPAHGSDMFQTLVQFTPGSSTYSYLLIRSGGRWYTTGTHEDQKMFKSWEALCAWLNSTYSHTNLTALMTTGLSFPTEYKAVRL
ncbi:MAG TPA: hypothetical protein DDY41_17760 [Arthrobacter bacterium]|jgi:hypothetical protein|nr:hypothetical protein [Arthrobacter sp.]